MLIYIPVLLTTRSKPTMEIIWSSWALLVCILITSLYIVYRISIRPSTPFALPILGHLHLIVKKPLHRTLAKLSEQHGSVLCLRYGYRKVILLSSSTAVEECMKRNDIAFANLPQLIVGEHLGYNYTILLFSPYGDHWRNLRRLITSQISSYRLEFFSNVRAQEIRSLVIGLFGVSNGGDFYKVEFKNMFFELMLNTVMQIVVGKNNMDAGEVQCFREVAKETVYLIGAANLADFLPFLRRFDLQGLEKRMKNSHDNQDRFVQKLVEKRRKMKDATAKDGEEKMNVIDMLLSRQETDPEYYTDEIIKGIIVTMLIAGTDTSTATMEWAISLLLNHPQVLQTAKDEIDKQVGQERHLNESDLPNLPYLHNIICETLRLYPTGPVSIRETSKDCAVGDINACKGTILQINIWAIHRDPDVWTEPTKFNPERFQGSECHKGGFKWMPFGSGRRRCPGEDFAMRMVGLALGSLIQCFEWKRTGEAMVDMSEGAGLTLPRAKPLVALCKPRPIMKCIPKTDCA